MQCLPHRDSLAGPQHEHVSLVDGDIAYFLGFPHQRFRVDRGQFPRQDRAVVEMQFSGVGESCRTQ